MASIIEELISVLEAETGCYDQLLTMANNKKDVIIQGNVPSLQEITEKEQEVAGRLVRLERKREESLKDICIVTNKKPAEMTITKIIEILNGQEKEQNQLKKISSKLATQLTDLKKINDLNQQLLQQSLDYIDFTMNAIQSSRSNPMGNQYQAKGNTYDAYTKRNFFDAKQ